MAAHGIACALMQLGKTIGLGENGFADGAGDEAALRRFFDNEHDLAHCADDTRGHLHEAGLEIGP